jgi:hypothetical protein
LKGKKVFPGVVAVTYELPAGTDDHDEFCTTTNIMQELLTRFLGTFGKSAYTDILLEHLERNLGGTTALRDAVKRYLEAPGISEIDDEAALHEMGLLLAAYGTSLKRRTAARWVEERHRGTIKGNSPNGIVARLDGKFKKFEQKYRESAESMFYMFNVMHTATEIRQILTGTTAEQDSRLQDLIRTWPGRYGRTTTDDELASLVSWVRKSFDHLDAVFTAESIERARASLENLVQGNPPHLNEQRALKTRCM